MYLLYASILSPLLPIFIGWKQAGKLLWLYPFVGFVIDVTAFVINTYTDSILHPALHNFFLLFEFVVLGMIYRRRIFPQSKLHLVVFLTVLGIFVVHTILYFQRVNFFFAGIFSIAYMLLALFGLYRILKEQSTPFLEKDWFFWFNTAILIYASGTCILFLFVNYMRSSYELQIKELWYVLHPLLNIAKNVLLIPAILYYAPILRKR